MTYKVLRRLAKGGFSEIFEVEDPASALPERLVLKRLSGEMSSLPQVRAAFAEEAKMLRELKHPNIVTFRRCYYDDEQRICLLMEKVEGETLDRWVQRHAAQPAIVLDLFDRVLSAVDYLHHRSSPLLHLDLKPENVLVTSTGREHQPVLIDFGIARRSRGPGLRAYTPPYGAPEQEAGGALDCATDVYALGQMLGEVLAASGGGSPALSALAVQARSPSRSKRPADAGAMRVAFRRARTAVSAAAAPRHATHRWAQHRRALLVTAAALVAAIGMAAVFVIARRPPIQSPPIAAEGAVGVGAEDAGRRFAGLIAKAEEALREEKYQGAESFYGQARVLATSMEGEQARKMDDQLRVLRGEIDLILQGGPAADTVRLDLQQKAQRGR